MFAKRPRDGSLAWLLAVRADAILFQETHLFMVETAEILRSFRAGGAERLTPKTPISFLGILIEMHAKGDISIPQTHYEKDPPKPDPSDYIKSGNAIGGKEFRTTMRQSLGSSIWANQTRPDVGYNIAKISTGDGPACISGDLARK